MLKFISIRTKIFVTLIGLTTACLTGFLFSSRNLVEKDKTASLFENNLNSLQTKTAFLRSIFQQWGALASTMALYLDQQNHSFGAVGTNLGSNNSDLKLATCMLESANGREPAAFLSQPDWEPKRADFEAGLVQKSPNVKKNLFELDNTTSTARYYLRVTSAEDPTASAFCGFVFSAARLKTALMGEGASQYLLVQQSGEPLFLMDSELREKWEGVRTQFDFVAPVEVSKMVNAADGRYLAGKVPVEGGYALVGLIPEAIVKKTLRDLMTRTATIFIIALMAVVSVSLLFSHGLTWNLTQLGTAVQRVAQGDFNFKLDIRSKDETALLADSFRKMSEEIKRLLQETAQKSRMEAELRTAKAVQDTLFPESNGRLPQMTIDGYYQSASECGGDWWFYYEQNGWLYFVIADATGHGASAALITSCARAVTSIYSTRDNLDLDTWARGLNHAIFETSKGSVLMTALLARFNLSDGAFEWVNCSHEFPLIRDSSGSWDYLLTDTCARLGEKRDYAPRIEKATLALDQQIFFFTDGLFDVQSPEGKIYGERNVIRQLKKAGESATQNKDELVDKLQNFSQGSELKDDVTFVFMQRKQA